MPFRITLPLVLVAAFTGAGLLLGRRDAVGDPGVIRFVSSMPRSGSARGQTDAIVNGIRIALDEVGNQIDLVDPGTNERRTVRIDYVDLDDATAAAGQWTIEQEIANANQARADPDVMAYLGTYNSGASKVSMPILNRAHLLMVSPANTAESLTKPDTGEKHEPGCYRPSGEVNFTRVCPTDDLQSELSVKWVRDLGCKKIYVLDDNELYGKGIAAGVRKACGQYGIAVLGSESVDTRAQEFKSLMEQVRTKAPDLVYYAGTTQGKAGQLLKDLIAVGLRCPMMAPDGCYEQKMLTSADASAFEKVKFYVTIGGPTIPGLKAQGGKGAAFVRKYAERFGKELDEVYGVYGYEAAAAAVEAVRLAGVKDRDAIRRAALRVRDFPGATGVWSFDGNGDTTNQTMTGSTVVVRPGPDGAKKAEFEFVRSLTRSAE